MIPPEQDAEFVATMEDVLELYEEPYNPEIPVVCMDEKPMQLIAETRRSLPLRPGDVERVDYEYQRCGTVSHFLFVEPLGNWRRVSVRDRRTSKDWAEEVAHLLDHDFPQAKKVLLICDNLNTHKAASFYETFPPDRARAYLQRLELHFTPKHGSWLNIAEIELSVLSRQCLQGYHCDKTQLQEHIHAWQQKRNASQKGVQWQFTTPHARVKLARLYPHTYDG